MDEEKNNQQSQNWKTDAEEKSGSEIDLLKKERDEYLEGWKRAKADLINYKKEEAKRFESVLSFANEAIIRDLINVLDSFDLAVLALERQTRIDADWDAPACRQAGISADEKRVGSDLKGVFLIRVQLEDALKKYGLARVIISVGQPFDPALQEAIAVVESDKPSGTVIDEVEKGYTLNGKLIRAARVRVAR